MATNREISSSAVDNHDVAGGLDPIGINWLCFPTVAFETHYEQMRQKAKMEKKKPVLFHMVAYKLVAQKVMMRGFHTETQ